MVAAALWGCALPALTPVACAQRVRTGAEVLLSKHMDLLRGKRVGVICNQTSVLPDGTHLVDTLVRLGVSVTALFSPEHGIRGTLAAGEAAGDSTDRKSGIRLFSLYGRTLRPTPAMLREVDVMLFDLQDVGARFYTFGSTMAHAMAACGEAGKRLIVLDRPNPINGVDVEGPVLDTAFRSFVGLFPVPVRHGLTLGELARMAAGEGWISPAPDSALTVIPMEGWKRAMWFDETGLPWVSPSPAMKTPATALVYPGTCLFEATSVSEGRGTGKPFETIGAPWIDSGLLAAAMRRKALPGVEFSPAEFVPAGDSAARSHPRYEGKVCRGVSITVTSRAEFRPFETARSLLAELRLMYPDSMTFRAQAFDRLAGTARERERVSGSGGKMREDESDQEARRTFMETRKKYLLY